jgi:hypothetical protein
MIVMIKSIISAALLSLSLTSSAQIHWLEKLWATDTVIAVPESVLPQHDFLFVSLIDGGGWVADGKGGVAKLTLDGKIIDTAWITRLNAPKGLGRVGNKLYVADMSEVIVIDINNGKIEHKIKIDSAQGLNDITTTEEGIVFVSDSRRGNIWRIENDIPAVYLQNIRGVNGLKAVKDELYIGAGKSFVKAGINKEIKTVAELPQEIDGIEPIGNGDFIVTSWGGWIFYVFADGKFETLLETHAEKKNTADIGYDPAKRILYVPTFNGKTVVGYRLK